MAKRAAETAQMLSSCKVVSELRYNIPFISPEAALESFEFF
jgi:hypothetical protein